MRLRLINDKMLLKYKSAGGAVSYPTGSGVTLTGRGTGMRLIGSSGAGISSRLHRKGFRVSSKRHPGKVLPGKFHAISRVGVGKAAAGKRILQRPPPPPCDNSSDSGLGFDQHIELQPVTVGTQIERNNCFVSENNNNSNNNNFGQSITANANDVSNSTALSSSNFLEQTLLHATVPTPVTTAPAPATKFIATRTLSTRAVNKRQMSSPPSNIATSSNGLIHLEIISQPEQQHRARYHTEGSRGAVKDRTGNGFPIVRLTGYSKPTTLQVFIGTDIGRVAPHMFYQACRVAGKNSTQCTENKVDGTMVIEIAFKPDSDMTIICDCVGILKERNVDVEHRFPEHSAAKNKKKSTRCRMVFRTELNHDDGTVETLQVCSNPIICTQPPGVPDICKISLQSCAARGGEELFIIGKNFSKDTRVLFQELCGYNASLPESMEIDQQLGANTTTLWQQTVLPDKDHFHQLHLICVVPPYVDQGILNPVKVQMTVVSSGRMSEPHFFVYTPNTRADINMSNNLQAAQGINPFIEETSSHWSSPSPCDNKTALVVETKHEMDSGMMPPPITTQVPVSIRHSPLAGLTPMITDHHHLAHLNAVVAGDNFKSELIDENSSQSAVAEPLHEAENLNTCAVTVLQFRDFSGKASAIIFNNESENMQSFPLPAMPSTSVINVEHATEQNMHERQLLQVAVNEQQQATEAQMEKFITSLAAAAEPTATDIVPGQSLFTKAITTDLSLNNILQEADSITSTQTAALSSPESVAECSMSAAPLQSPNSSMVQDVVLPSPSIAGDRATQTLANAHANLDNDIDMVSSVGPSMMCAANAATTSMLSNIMTPHPGDMASCILRDIEQHAPPTQEEAAAAAIALSNIVVSSSAMAQVNDSLSTNRNAVQKSVDDGVSNIMQQSSQQQAQECGEQMQLTAANPVLTNRNAFGGMFLNQAEQVSAHVTAKSVQLSAMPSNAPAILPTAPESLLISLTAEGELKVGASNDVILPQQNAALNDAAAAAPLTQPMQELAEIYDQDVLTYIFEEKQENLMQWHQ